MRKESMEEGLVGSPCLQAWGRRERKRVEVGAKKIRLSVNF